MPANTVIKIRRGTSAEWTSANPTLAAGELGFETDTARSKLGDGATAWTALGYTVGDSSGVGTVEWTSVLNKPTEFTPVAHTHVLSDITDYVDPTIYIDGGAANTVFAAYAAIDGGNSGSF